MVQGSDMYVPIEEALASPKRGDDKSIPAGHWQWANCKHKDESEPLINFKKPGGRKESVSKKEKATIMNKNDLVSMDIQEDQKSSNYLAGEGGIPYATKAKELLVYTRRFKGAKRQGDCHNPSSNLMPSVDVIKFQGARLDNLAPGQGVEIADVSASSQNVNGSNDSIPVAKANKSNKQQRRRHKQFDLNVPYGRPRKEQGHPRKEQMYMRRERQKARIGFKSGMSLQHQHMVPLEGPTAPLQMTMPLVTTHMVPLFGSSSLNPGHIGSCSKQAPSGPSGKFLELCPPSLSACSSQNDPLGDAWSEEELDALWMGVRRHGEGNWGSIMRDPRLHFSPYRRPNHLFERWTVEKVKALSVDHIQEEPCRHPEGHMTGEVHPQATKRPRGTLIIRPTHQKNKIAAGSTKKGTLFLGGAFPLTDAMDGFSGKEVSSEGTISD